MRPMPSLTAVDANGPDPLSHYDAAVPASRWAWVPKACFGGACVLTLALFAALATYAQPRTDDFSELGFIPGHTAFEYMGIRYVEWTGRFGYAFLSHVLYSLFDPFKHYYIVPWLTMAAWLLAFYAALRSVAGQWVSRGQAAGVSVMLTTLYLAGMPGAAKGLFWWMGCITNQLCLIGLLCTIACCASQPRHAWSRALRLVGLVASVLLSVATYDTTAPFVIAILAGGALLNWRLRGHNTWPWIVATGLAFACFVVVVIAPGNAVRAGHFTHDKNLIVSIDYGITNGLKWLSATALSGLSLLTAVLMVPAAARPAHALRQALGRWTRRSGSSRRCSSA